MISRMGVAAGVGLQRGKLRAARATRATLVLPILMATVSPLALLVLNTSSVLAAGLCSEDTVTVPGTRIVSCPSTVSIGVGVDNTPGFSFSESASAGGNANVSVGGAGGAGRHLDITTLTGIATYGLNSIGFQAFTTGGDGGNVTTAGVGGNGGRAGNILFDNGALIETQGDGSHAIGISSTGGNGGGVSGSGVGGTGGESGNVSVTNSGVITTEGSGAHGIYALTKGGNGGGGGGIPGDGGAAGTVTVTTTENITVSGAGSHGILAESVSGANGSFSGVGGQGNSVSVTVDGATIAGGSGSGRGVKIVAVGNATLINSGRISALSGTAIEMSSNAAALVTNTGTVTGDVLISGATANFNNAAGGELISGATFSGDLNNSGVLSPGGTNSLQSTTLTGDFAQTSGGRYQVDADWVSGNADQMVISGAADLAGKVVVNPLNFPTTPGLTKTFTILTAVGGITNNGITAVDTAAVDYSLLYPDANTLNLKAVIDFTPEPTGLDTSGFTNNQTAVGGTLNRIVGAGGSPEFVAPLMTLSSEKELAEALDQLAPQGDGGSFSSAMGTGATFAGQLLSCKTLGEGDANAFIREGQCLWVRANARHTDNDGGSNKVGFDETATFYSAGAQFDIGGPWRLGAGAGFETADLATESNATSETDRMHLGAVVKYNPGPLLLAAGITGGKGWADNERFVSFGGFNGTATSDTDQSFVTGRLTGAYLLSYGHWYAKPQVDLALTHLERDAYTESGAGGIALDVDKASDTVFSVSPSLELGAQYALSAGGVARPFVKAGLTWMDQDSFVTTASFADAPAGVAGFAIVSEVDDIVADIGAGVDFISGAGTVLRLQYDGRFGETTEQHGGTAKISVPF